MKKMMPLIFTICISHMMLSQNFVKEVSVDANDWIQPKIIDLNNDGLEDFVSVSRDGSIAWWKKDNTSNFTKVIIDETVISWNNLDVADIDGDNDIDILISAQDDIWIYYNDGNQNFSSTYISYNSFSSNILAGDFNADGRIDFISTSRASGANMKLWLNNSNGVFNEVIIDTLPVKAGDMLINDIDNDGDLDLVIAIASGFWTEKHIKCYINDGNGNFNDKEIDFSLPSKHIQILDYDNDGDKDIAVVVNNTAIFLLINDGNLNFSSTNIASNHDLESMHIIDFDNDGDMDISVVFEEFFGFYINDGNENFNLHELSGIFDKGERISNLDVNGDGFQDFLVTSSDFDDPRLIISQQAQTFDTKILDDSLVSPSSFHSDDIDNDGLQDIVSTSRDEHELILWHNLGDFTFNKIVIDSTEPDIKYAHIGDLNGDGHKDILVTTTGFNKGQILLFTNDGNLNFTKSVFRDIKDTQRAFIEDLNNDGNLDVICTYYSPPPTKVKCLVSDGNGNFTDVNVEGTKNAICVGYLDLNNDGHKDLVTNEDVYYQNDGALNFTEVSLSKRYGGWYYDLDKDGDIDIITANQFSTFSISWLENDGSGNFTEHVIQTNNINGNDMFTFQDFDGDGDIDFVSCPKNQDSNRQLSFWENDGNQNFTRLEIDFYYQNVFQLLSDDFDGDGDIDVLSSSAKFPLTIWKNTSDISVLSISKTTKNINISIYPNPSKDVVNIYSNDIILKKEMHSINGNKINTNLLGNKINMKNVPNGIYILKITTQKGSQSFKIIKE